MPSAITRTRADGTFSFHGLPADYSRRLAFEPRFTLDPLGPLWSRALGDNGVRIDASIQEAELDLLALGVSVGWAPGMSAWT